MYLQAHRHVLVIHPIEQVGWALLGEVIDLGPAVVAFGVH